MWAILSKDSTDTFVEEFEDYDLYAVDFFPTQEKAKEKYKEIKGKISNVFLVEIKESEVNI
jgi:hypothetical protein